MGSLIFFLAAMLREEGKAAYIAVGVVFLIISGGSYRKRGPR